MQNNSPVADPLTVLPPELVLRVLEFASLSTVAALTAVSKAWHQFIDLTHQDAIYSALSKSSSPPNPTLSRWFDDVTSCKQFCERQTLLAHNWETPTPVSRERILQVGNDPVWRFRADLKRRFIVSTSHAGGFNVTDIDTGRLLWRLPSTLDTDNEHAVRPYAHLEYQDGMVVFDREGDAVEVWQADVDDAPRGEFRRIAILDHDCQTRGFQLSYWTLCVVSTQGQGFVYDMTKRPPTRITHLQIEHEAVGHLDQSADTVIYSMGPRGYHAYDKKSGEFKGILQPSDCIATYHIRPPKENFDAASTRLAGLAQRDPVSQYSSPSPPTVDNFVPIKLRKGPLPPPEDPEHVRNGEDEWGAGMINGDLFVGVSRAGRTFVCSDWRRALRGQSQLAECSAMIECESDGSTFDLGGWLSVRNHRLMFEIQDRVYVVSLDDENRIQEVDSQPRPSYSFLTCSMPQLAVPVSFMALYDDAIMSTYTTLGRRQPPANTPDANHHEGPARIFPTKTIRILSMAPSGRDMHIAQGAALAEGRSGDADQSRLPADEIARSQALLQLLSMLREEYAEEGEEQQSDDGWEDVREDVEEDESDEWMISLWADTETRDREEREYWD